MLSIRILLLSLAALLVADFPIAAQTAARGGSKLPSESSLNRFGLTRRWWGHATVNFNRDKLVFLTVDEEYLFLQSSAGVVTAFDCETGRQLWARTLGSRDRPTFRASLNDELLFVVNGMKLYAARKKTGDIVWELNLPAQASSSPVADDERVFVGFLDGSMYAFDLEKIQDRYSAGLLPQYSAETVLWRYRTNRPITIPAVPGGKLVAFASQNGSLYSLAADTHRMVFQFETDAKLSAPMVRYENNLLLASEDSNFYSLNLLNGKPAWQFTTGVVIRKAPVLIEDEVYLIPERHNLYKLSAEKGVAEWKQPEIDTFLSASSERVFVVGRHNELVILARDTGKRLGSFPLDRFTMHLPNEHSDRIYLATEAGLIMCLHELGRDFPRFHLHPERQPALPEFAEDPAPDQSADDTAAQDAAEDADEEMTPEDAPVEEAVPEEEAPAEEMTEEAPLEAESPGDEAPDAEALDDDAPVEESPAEEAPAEETPSEETPSEEAPTEDAPTEDTPTEDTPTENP